jgi:excisionase family DNA binding protein
LKSNLSDIFIEFYLVLHLIHFFQLFYSAKGDSVNDFFLPAKNQKKRRTHLMPTRTSKVLDVKVAAELLTVSADTVYDLFKRGELPGRKVGRKWLTTRNALLRWIESSSENNTLARAIERGDRHVITTALKSGKVQIKKR